MTHLAFTVDMIDVDRMNRPLPSGGKLGARAWVVGAWVLAFALWMAWRWWVKG